MLCISAQHASSQGAAAPAPLPTATPAIPAHQPRACRQLAQPARQVLGVQAAVQHQARVGQVQLACRRRQAVGKGEQGRQVQAAGAAAAAAVQAMPIPGAAHGTQYVPSM